MVESIKIWLIQPNIFLSVQTSITVELPISYELALASCATAIFEDHNRKTDRKTDTYVGARDGWQRRQNEQHFFC